MTLSDLTQNVKLAYVTGLGTAGTGLSTVLEWIPTDIGKLASLIGIVFTMILIRVHHRNGRAQYEKTMLEVSILKQDFEARDEKTRLWKKSGVERRG